MSEPEGATDISGEEAVLEAASLSLPPRVLDTSDLGEILALGDLALLPGESEMQARIWASAGERSSARVLREREQYRTWLREARFLAARGVRPGPSHYALDDGFFSSFNGGFADASWEDGGSARGSTTPRVYFGRKLTRSEYDLSALRSFPSGWRAVSHQSSGVLCRHPRFVGIPLLVKDAMLGAVRALGGFADRLPGGHSCIGLAGVDLSELVAYDRELRDYGLSAEWAYRHLEEAIYPLDRTCAHLISDTVVPSDDVVWPRKTGGSVLTNLFASWPGDTAQWGVFIFGDNCD
jgi:hypothetical protein